MRPRSIVVFEVMILASLVLGAFSSFMAPIEQLRQVPLWSVVIAQGGVLLIMVALTLLISRRRSNTAKWVSIAMFILGLPLYFKMVGEGTIDPRVVQLIQIALQTVGYAFLFTPGARKWLRGEG